MAEIDNLTEINENFDTVKTLLNSIRAQGILNTSDVDKLLTGINAKLEKINTEEDIDLIKVYLSELKQNLDERHDILLSKFGAIESLFSNLLKNSNDLPKSNELKDLFDIVATNLSVFSREVVAQKESLTDITLRLDAMRSDDSAKKDIIKNITLLKPDLERLNNGFDSIVLSLNDNFKSIIKTISSIDQTEHLNKFSDSLNSIQTSSNALLSAIQMLDRKSDSVETLIKKTLSKDDFSVAERKLSELSAIGLDLTNKVEELNAGYYRVDNLADKIDASVNIIASLKSVLEENENSRTEEVLNKLSELNEELLEIKNKDDFESFKSSLSEVLEKLIKNTEFINTELTHSKEEILKIVPLIESLGLDSFLVNIETAINQSETGIKSYVSDKLDKVTTITEANFSNILSNLNSSADNLSVSINKSAAGISELCENKFGSIFENISDLRKIISQLDENSVSADNAMFSNITDRLTLFESTLKETLESQTFITSNLSSEITGQVENIKNLSGVIDYKMDSSVVEITNLKREFEGLKTSIDEVLALNFTETVKDLRADLYASKQDLTQAFETSESMLSDKFSNDLFSKYELLISKMDSIEDEFKKIQTSSMMLLKDALEKISSSLVDVMSYVSEAKEAPNEQFDRKLDKIAEIVQENTMGYLDDIRGVVDLIRIQLENNIKGLEEDSLNRLNVLENSILKSNDNIKEDIQTSYDKILSIANINDEIKSLVSANSEENDERFEKLISAAENINSEFETKLNYLKAELLNKVSEFKQEFDCKNVEAVNEFKFSIESITSKSAFDLAAKIEELLLNIQELHESDKTQRILDLDNISSEFLDIKSLLSTFSSESSDMRAASLEKLVEHFSKIELQIDDVASEIRESEDSNLDAVLNGISEIKELLNSISLKNQENRNSVFAKLTESLDVIKTQIDDFSNETSTARTTTLSKLLENFVGLKEYITATNLKNGENLTKSVNSLISQLEEIKQQVTNVDKTFDEDFTRQISIIESNFESLISQLNILFEKNEKKSVDIINDRFSNISDIIDARVSEKLESYKAKIEETFDKLSLKSFEHSGLVKDFISKLDSDMKQLLSNQAVSGAEHLDSIERSLKSCLDENKKLSSEDYKALKIKVDEYTGFLKEQNFELIRNLTEGLDNVSQKISALLDEKEQITNLRISNLESSFHDISEDLLQNGNSVIEAVEVQSINANKTIDELNNISESIKYAKSDLIDEIGRKSDYIVDSVQGQVLLVSETKEKINDIANLIDSSKSDLLNVMKEANESSLDLAKEQSYIVNEAKESVDRLSDIVNDSKTDINAAIKQSCSDIIDSSKEQIALSNNIADKLHDFVDYVSISQEEMIEKLNNGRESIQNSINEQKDIANKSIEHIDTLSESVNGLTETLVSAVENSIAESSENSIELISKLTEESSSSINSALEKLLQQINIEKDIVETGKTFISEFIQQELSLLSSEVQKETDVIISELVEQFDSLRKSQSNETLNVISGIEPLIANEIYNNIEDLKTYLDKNNQYDIIFDKLDNLKTDVMSAFENATKTMNNMLAADVFTDSMADYKTANEIVINSAVERIHDIFEDFVNDNNSSFTELILNQGESIQSKLSLFDKKFIDTVVDKYEEIKLLSNHHKECFANIDKSLSSVISGMEKEKASFELKIQELANMILESADTTDNEIQKLYAGLESIKSTLSDKLLSEDFQHAMENKVDELKELIDEQLGYLVDINELCTINLPDISELSVHLKTSITKSIDDVSKKIDSISDSKSIESELNKVKSDIITCILNLFNQISFVTEQEEILDFIQEKHDELIKVLSHIVTVGEDLYDIKQTVLESEDKINLIKSDISLLNQKISSIISSNGDIDYVYSLQDLESDIANLRVALAEIKDSNKPEELSELLSSTEKVYNLVESIKDDFPAQEQLRNIAEDIESISTRTNKLILASDESYKTLKDNLQDFKLVINDLDERTRNFAHESGMDRIDSKLNALNSMVQNGAKTNQVFNEVFEYLAEWVDNASVQINSISDKVETLDDIGQIKVMLADLKANSEDNSDNIELIESLGNIFDKQIKKINSVEMKIDRMIVENTIKNDNKELDLKPFEATLNKFLVAIGDKITSQQERIDSLESTLKKVVQLLDEKDTAQITKKMGGMDRQIAKLNKSIEKIASHVIEE